MKKFFIILFCVVISLLASITNDSNIFLTDSKTLIGILLTLLGLCFTSFSFMSTSICSILNKANCDSNKELRKKLDKMLESIQKDIFFIFYSTIVLIIINLIFYLDFPLLINPINIDFGLFIVYSLKRCILNFSVSLIFCLSAYSLYDLLKASFNLLKKGY